MTDDKQLRIKEAGTTTLSNPCQMCGIQMPLTAFISNEWCDTCRTCVECDSTFVIGSPAERQIRCMSCLHLRKL